MQLVQSDIPLVSLFGALAAYNFWLFFTGRAVSRTTVDLWLQIKDAEIRRQSEVIKSLEAALDESLSQTTKLLSVGDLSAHALQSLSKATPNVGATRPEG